MGWIIFIVVLVAYLVYDDLSFQKQQRDQGQLDPQDGDDWDHAGEIRVIEPENTGSKS